MEPSSEIRTAVNLAAALPARARRNRLKRGGYSGVDGQGEKRIEDACRRGNVLKALFTVFASAAGCLLLVTDFANAQNHSSAAERSFAQAPRTPQAARCKMLRTYGA